MLSTAIRLILGLSLLASGSVLADTAHVTECDEFANHPSDPLKVTPGVAQEDVDTAAAKAACAQALSTDPDNGRFLYQLGRSFFY